MFIVLNHSNLIYKNFFLNMRIKIGSTPFNNFFLIFLCLMISLKKKRKRVQCLLIRVCDDLHALMQDFSA